MNVDIRTHGTERDAVLELQVGVLRDSLVATADQLATARSEIDQAGARFDELARQYEHANGQLLEMATTCADALARLLGDHPTGCLCHDCNLRRQLYVLSNR